MVYQEEKDSLLLLVLAVLAPVAHIGVALVSTCPPLLEGKHTSYIRIALPDTILAETLGRISWASGSRGIHLNGLTGPGHAIVDSGEWRR